MFVRVVVIDAGLRSDAYGGECAYYEDPAINGEEVYVRIYALSRAIRCINSVPTRRHSNSHF